MKRIVPLITPQKSFRVVTAGELREWLLQVDASAEVFISDGYPCPDIAHGLSCIEAVRDIDSGRYDVVLSHWDQESAWE